MSILERILEVFVEEVADRAVAKIRATTVTVAPEGPAAASIVTEPAPAPAAAEPEKPKGRKKRTPTETVVDTPEKAVEAIKAAEAPAAPQAAAPAAPTAPTPAGAITQERVNAVREALRTYAAKVAQESEGKTDGRAAALEKLAKYAPRAMDLKPGQDEELIKELSA